MMKITLNTILRLVLSLLVAVFILSCGQAHADDISDVIEDISMKGALGDIGVLLAKANAYAHETDNKLQYASDFKGDRKTFSGKYLAPALPENLAGKYVYGLALLSDDGCNVTVNQKRVLSLYEQPIALPDTGSSFKILDVRLEPNSEAEITVEYSNVKYTAREGSPDIDGCTLFVFLKAANVELESVSFSGHQELCSDDATTPYAAPHWTDIDGNGAPDSATLGEHNYSVAYTKKTRPSVGAVIRVRDLQVGQALNVKAKASNGMEISHSSLEVENGKAVFPQTAVVDAGGNEQTWPDAIMIYKKNGNEPFKLDWNIKSMGALG